MALSTDAALEVARCTLFKERVCEITEAYARLVVDYERLQAAKDVLVQEKHTLRDAFRSPRGGFQVAGPLDKSLADLPLPGDYVTEEYSADFADPRDRVEDEEDAVADECEGASAAQVLQQGNLLPRFSLPTQSMTQARASAASSVFSTSSVDMQSVASRTGVAFSETHQVDILCPRENSNCSSQEQEHSGAGSGSMKYGNSQVVVQATMSQYGYRHKTFAGNRRGALLLNRSGTVQSFGKQFKHIFANQSIQSLAKAIMLSHSFEGFMAIVILFNTGIMIKETDDTAQCDGEGTECLASWLLIVNYVLLVIYTLELLLSVYAYQSEFHKAASRWLDFSIVFLGWLDIILTTVMKEANLPGAAMLRVFRLARLARAARLLIIFPELNSMIQGFASAMKAMVWGFMMLMVLLLIWSIVTVELVGPVPQRIDDYPSECADTFESVWETCVLFFQTLTAGDSWGKCSRPVIDEEPATFMVFAGSLVCVQLGFTNLIMSVIIDRATEAREKNVQARLADKRQQMVVSRTRLYEFCERMDTNKSGDIDVEEFIKGFDTMPELRTCLELYGLERSDLPQLINLIDETNSGALSYGELVSVFEKVDHCDLRMQMMISQLFLKEIGRRVESRLDDSEAHLEQLQADISRQTVAMSMASASTSRLNSTNTASVDEHERSSTNTADR